MEVEKFDEGQSNPTFLLRTGSGKYVLRRKPPGVLLQSAHAVDREYRVIHSLADTDVPVPMAYHLCEDDAVIGSAFYVMSFEPGKVPTDLPAGYTFLRHIGMYAYRAGVLRRVAAQPQGAHERAESLEQLRALAMGIGIHVTTIAEAPTPGVDTEEDLQRVQREFAT